MVKPDELSKWTGPMLANLILIREQPVIGPEWQGLVNAGLCDYFAVRIGGENG